MNISDAESAFLSAKAEVDNFTADFLREWYAPVGDMAARMFWQSQPEKVKQQLRRMSPKEAAVMDKMTEGVKPNGRSSL